MDELAGVGGQGGEGCAIAEEEVEEEDAEDAGQDVADGAIAPDGARDRHAGGNMWCGVVKDFVSWRGGSPASRSSAVCVGESVTCPTLSSAVFHVLLKRSNAGGCGV